jgi:hypothetical protein
MKTMLLTLVAAATVLAAPAISTAQPAFHSTAAIGGFRGAHFDTRASAELNGRIGSLETRISLGRRSGAISFREATRLTGKLNEVTALKRSFERSGRGLTGMEVATLNARLDALSGQVRVQARDNNRR